MFGVLGQSRFFRAFGAAGCEILAWDVPPLMQRRARASGEGCNWLVHTSSVSGSSALLVQRDGTGNSPPHMRPPLCRIDLALCPAVFCRSSRQAFPFRKSCLRLTASSSSPRRPHRRAPVRCAARCPAEFIAITAAAWPTYPGRDVPWCCESVPGASAVSRPAAPVGSSPNVCRT